MRPGYNHKTGAVYDQQKKEKEQVRWQLRAQMKENPLSVPLELDFIFYFGVPKSTSAPRRKDMLQDKIHHMIKPDNDNCQKYLLDCMTGVIYVDDCQVVDIHARKVYGDSPRTVICVRPLSSCTYKGNEKFEGLPLFEEGEEWPGDGDKV
jgi:Holliday junction resolvase RusA-like endonuclease